jgi:hypothetical protein
MKNSEIKFEFRNKNVRRTLEICAPFAAGLARQSDELKDRINAGSFLDAFAETGRLEAEYLSQLARARATLLKLRQSNARMKEKAALSARLMCGVAGTDADLLGVGLHLRKTPAPVGVPAAPTGEARPGPYEGSVLLILSRPVRRCFFEIQWTADPKAGPWIRLDCFCSSRVLLENQPRGRNLWYRVRARNGHGPGAWSQPIRAYA